MFKCKMTANACTEGFLAVHTLSLHKHIDIHRSLMYYHGFQVHQISLPASYTPYTVTSLDLGCLKVLPPSYLPDSPASVLLVNHIAKMTQICCRDNLLIGKRFLAATDPQ